MATADETPQPDATAAGAPAQPDAEEQPAQDDVADPAGESGEREGTSDEDREGEERDATTEGQPDPLAEAERQRDQYLDHLRRERAEFENYRRRAARERSEAADRGAEQLVSSLMGVLDNFGFILEAAKDSSDEALSKGAQMVYAELMDVLGKAGLEIVPGEGEPFDPTHHEAMLQVEAEEPVDEPMVADVLRPGYRFKGRVLRPASVSVKQ